MIFYTFQDIFFWFSDPNSVPNIDLAQKGALSSSPKYHWDDILPPISDEIVDVFFQFDSSLAGSFNFRNISMNSWRLASNAGEQTYPLTI